MQKRKVKKILTAIAALLVLLPLFNFSVYRWGNLGTDRPENLLRSKIYFTFDAAAHLINPWLYNVGISASPSETYIGKNGWLFLGDAYDRAVSNKRMHDSATTANDLATTGATNLHQWARAGEPHSTHVFIRQLNSRAFIETQQALIDAKKQYGYPLYYKTDSHWNHLGAWTAYKTFAENLKQQQLPLEFLIDESIKIHPPRDRIGGDLAKFLRMRNAIADQEIDIELINPKASEVVDLKLMQKIPPASYPHLTTPRRPLSVTTKTALNNSKVFWLRDSFGNSLSPFLSATFSNVVQVHYYSMDAKSFS
jgi:alginate O-acetyltransferase complex protein AlgJ